jgi:hypothetical protein
MSIDLQRPGINSEVKVPFRWYQNNLLKNKYKRQCRELERSCGYRLLTPPDRLLSFQFYRATSAATITSWTIYDLDGNLVETLDESLLTIVPITDTDEPCDYIIYDGDSLGLDLASNYYYSVIEDSDGNEFYSEDFYAFCLGTQPNILENGDFEDGDLGWTAEEVVIASGKACFNTAGFLPRYLQHAVTVVNSTTYKVTVYLSGIVGSGSLVVTLGGGSPVSIVNPTNGSYVIYCTSASGSIIDITMSSPMVGCLEFVQIEAVADDTACNARIRWSNSCQFVGNIFYPEGYINEFFLDVGVEPISPVANIIREYDENGNKEKILRRQRRETTYNLEVGQIPWYVADALMEMSLHDNITLDLANGLGTGTMKYVDVDITWDDFGVQCLASCNISFQLDDATVTDGCCDGDIIPPITLCTERFCDPELNLIEAIITDFTYTDSEAIADGLSTDSAPYTAPDTAWTEQQLCTTDVIPNGDVIIGLLKTILDSEKYIFRFTIDSISGIVEIYRDGILGATYTTPGDYEVYFTPEVGATDIYIEFKASGDTEVCITFDTLAIWVPCMEPLSEGWVGYDEGLLFTGTPTGSGVIQADSISSNYTYVIEIDYELPVPSDCFRVVINGTLIRTVTNGPDPDSGTVTFNYDPRDYGIAQDVLISVIFVPCDSETTIVGLSGIRFCGILY